MKNKYGEAQVKIGTVFDRYLHNATQRYNQIRTLTTGTMPRRIIGKDSLYVQIGLNHNGEEIDTSSVDSLLQISRNLLILGTGGVGKSMLTRYLFLFDGFDEVKSSLAKETAEAIQKFSAKYPNNSFIVTSRPKAETSPLETFTTMESMPLSKAQAVDLASRIWVKDEKTMEFCRQLKEILYEKHKDFAENPLLLSMMFLTFMRNSSIPEHLSDFYKKAYDALYSAHDNQDKGCYRRDFECKTLDENEFKRILSHFCFHSYFKEDYEFSEAEIIRYLQNSLDKLGLAEIRSVDYLTDLRNVVCMIIKDGDIYRFSHRSFQTYFAAYYSAHSLTDEQQKRLFTNILSDGDVYFGRIDYYDLLMQIELDRFAENALECGLRNLIQKAGATQRPDEFLLRTAYDRIENHTSSLDEGHTTNERIFYGVISESSSYYDFNILSLFYRCSKSYYSDFDDITHEYRSNKEQAIKNYVKLILQPEEFRKDGHEFVILFEKIDTTDCITDDERQRLYNLIIEYHWGKGICMRITEWLDKLDMKRALLESPSFIDNL